MHQVDMSFGTLHGHYVRCQAKHVQYNTKGLVILPQHQKHVHGLTETRYDHPHHNMVASVVAGEEPYSRLTKKEG